MRLHLKIPMLLLLAASMQSVSQDSATQVATAQNPTPATQDATPAEPNYDFRYTLRVIDDATFFSDLIPPLPAGASQTLTDPKVTLLQNQLLLEPSFTLRYHSRWTLASSVVALADTHGGLSAADFNLPASSPATPEAAKPEAAKVAPPAPTPATTPVPTAPSRPAKKGGLRKIGRFFKRLFGG